MRILVLTTEYESFLKWHYGRHPRLARASYPEQLRSRIDTLFGSADFYSRNFIDLGHQAEEIFVNNIWLQTAWAREHGLIVPVPPDPTEASGGRGNDAVMALKRKLRPYRRILEPLARQLGYVISLSKTERRILLSQIELANPDIILNQVPHVITAEILTPLKRSGRVIIAQHGNAPPENFDPTPYNFGIAIVPAIAEAFRARGLETELCNLAFEPSILERLPPPPPKDIDISFVGGLSSNHTQRIELLEAVARELPVELYLSSFSGIPPTSPLHARRRGEVWGTEMYGILRRSRITLNSHIDAAGGYAANMRLYEATGVGTFLLTDNLKGLPALFSPGVHVATYDSAADCVAKIKYYMANSCERDAIARAGQLQTLSRHTYRLRAEEILRLADRYRR